MVEDPLVEIAEKIKKAKANGHDPAPPTKVWPVLDPAALYGLPGEIVRAIAPHSEGDPVALLIQTLSGAGNAIGRGPHFRVEGDLHCTNLSAVLVGESAKARKGTSLGRVKQTMTVADHEWTSTRITGGLSSGEGLIWAVRDPIMKWETRGKGDEAEQVEVIADPGVEDKRLMVIEPEYASVLAVMKRDGSTLSTLLRNAWDHGDLSSLTKNSRAKATGAHISIIGHITTDELRAMLDEVTMANGYANRVLWLMVKRSNILPFGGALDEKTIVDLGHRLGQTITAARSIARVEMTPLARVLWADIYPDLSEGKPGLLGAITARGEAQTIRLALIYTLLDGQWEIDIVHLNAALALWNYCAASVSYIWSDTLGDPVADTIMRALRTRPNGMAKAEINALFSNHRVSAIERALALLLETGKASFTKMPTAGRPTELWTVC